MVDSNVYEMRPSRVPVYSDATIRIGAEVIPCQTLNLSECGMALVCPAGRSVGQELRVEFFLASIRGWISIDALVVRCKEDDKGYIWGIQFCNLDNWVREYIAGYIEDTTPFLSAAC